MASLPGAGPPVPRRTKQRALSFYGRNADACGHQAQPLAVCARRVRSRMSAEPMDISAASLRIDMPNPAQQRLLPRVHWEKVTWLLPSTIVSRPFHSSLSWRFALGGHRTLMQPNLVLNLPPESITLRVACAVALSGAWLLVLSAVAEALVEETVGRRDLISDLLQLPVRGEPERPGEPSPGHAISRSAH